jgi:hypothetical protein
MAFRRETLEALGGFDARYRSAGDDVDLCWRLMEQGGTIGFHAGAMDWHHRRNSLLAYWRQQKGYGKAEALLEEKWPERYNAVGHLVWRGRLYGKGYAEPLQLNRWHVYQGTWGTAAYQSLYERAPGTLASLPLMPEWALVVMALALLSVLGAFFWPTLAIVTVPLLAGAASAPVAQAIDAALRADFPTPSRNRREELGKRILTVVLHLVQPAARLIGRVQHGLLPWRRRGLMPWRRSGSAGGVLGWRSEASVWSETWRAPEQWTERLESALQMQGAVVMRAGDFDRWDLHVRGGLFGAARGLLTVEEHGAGKQLVRMRVTPWAPAMLLTVGVGLIALAVLAFSDGARIAGGALALIATVLTYLHVHDSGRAAAAWIDAVDAVRGNMRND